MDLRIMCAKILSFQCNEMIDLLLTCTFILLYAYGLLKKKSERFVNKNSKMVSLMLHTAIKVAIIAGIIQVDVRMITAMLVTFINIK